jgi:hypothetical protein
MKKIISFSIEEDHSEIHSEAHKARMTGGKLKNTAKANVNKDKIEIKIKPKCSK